MPIDFEFSYHGTIVTATVEIAFKPSRKRCTDCGTDTEYVSREYVEHVLELQENGGIIVPVQSIPLKRIRKEATERLDFRPLCNNCVAKSMIPIQEWSLDH